MTSEATSAALNFVGGIPFQLLYDGVKMAIRKTTKFRIHLMNLQLTLECLQSQSRVIQQIGEYNVQLNLPNNVIEDLQRKMNEGIQLVGMLSKLSMWNIRIWGNCYNCIGVDCGEQLDELDRSLRRLLQLLEFEHQRNVTEILVLARYTKDKQDEMDKRQAEFLRLQQEMFAMLMEQHNAPERIATNSVPQVALSNGGEGAAPALGQVFQLLFSAVIQLEVKNMVFRRLFQRFKSTLNCLQPLVEEISKSTRVLYLPKQEVENFIICIKNGLELVHECSKVCKKVTYRKYDYINKILNLDESLQMLFIELKRQVRRSLKEAMDSANSIEAAISGVVQKNEVASNAKEEILVNLERVVEEVVKPIEGSDAVQDQMETDQLPHVETSDDGNEETLLDLARVKDEMIKPIDEGSDMLKNQTECEIAAAEPPSSLPAVESALESTSNANAGLKQPEEKEAVPEHLQSGAISSMTSFTRWFPRKNSSGERKQNFTLLRKMKKGNVILWILPFNCNKKCHPRSCYSCIKPFQHTKEHRETEIIMQTMTFPEECLVDIISFTTPADVCRLSSISKSFKLAGEADEVWEKFLPPQHDIDTILSQSTSASTSAAAAESKVPKKELYLALCDKSVLIDNGKMSFFLDKWSGKKCYMISARALYIVWAEEKSNQYWTWICLPESRFKDVVYLESVCWIEIHGRIDMRMLSPSTLYKAYLVYKLTAEAYGLKAPVQVATQVGHYGLGYGDLAIEIYENRQKGFLYPAKQVSGVRSPKERVDGWLEIELGEFLCQEEDDSQVDMICVEIDDLCWKKGLVVEGIEVRPERKEYCKPKGKARAKERAKGKRAMTMI